MAATKPRRRRDKPQFSCNTCRQRRTRCDRLQPCSNCASRGQPCVYVRTKPSRDGTPGVHDRVVQLERLVKSLMPDANQKTTHLPTPESSDNNVRQEPGSVADGQSECGSMHISGSELRYVTGEHWAAILDSIADLKAHCDREEQLDPVDTHNEKGNDSNAEPPSPRPLVLYGCPRATSRTEIIAALPPKSAVDRYISRYFNYLDLVASAAVHGPSFLREYEAFWANPLEVPIAWVGLLFSMMCLAVMASDPAEGEANRSLQIDLYHEKTVQCLVIGEYTKPGPYVLETVIHYLYIEMVHHPDADRHIWFLLSLEVNMAFRMGYHRDPSHFPGLSPLQGEMRRRLWATVVMSDVLLSSQMGMPRMISDWKCDTAEPRNLHDSDLDEETAQTPPSRPETEYTTTLGIIARSRMVLALGKIADLADAVKPVTYAEVMQADRALQEAVTTIPPPLRMKEMAASVTDSPQLIMSRLFLEHMLYKGQIMLHRRFFEIEQTDNSFAYSHTTCLDACLSMLLIQQVLDEETCPGGQLQEMRWRITSSMNHQFLTAMMILCSLVHRGRMLDRTEEIVTALRRTRAIWMRQASRSCEAKRAADVLNLTLARAVEGTSQSQGAERNVMPSVRDNFSPSSQRSHDYLFSVNSLGGDATLEDWVQSFFSDTQNVDASFSL
ncbi:hypothetical protein BO70DRAFT_372948 [Aspergillus heteromorphus CBS 117.55]|uniref:Zn(2)-C6 fungal-type domain-containing protein n=1 Tax=Aspergillus heteromorphus CBS 117.55 TaxID=1448321 RepID=A0A317VM59_9EURO|nr:uncharacterized protein BO70DRAFT_372948 [Aspergillus heteromorphus CBS 117.55]PWY74311.1 hypothetical protein BO70DRAFT_372948 [Aspergillus heteromorphus CBS 117.55]